MRLTNYRAGRLIYGRHGRHGNIRNMEYKAEEAVHSCNERGK